MPKSGYVNPVSEQGSTSNPPTRPETPGADLPALNLNNYATKKTLAQGMLDLALLTANATQLKYLLDVGDAHPYYTLLLTLIIASICLQTIQAIVCVILGMIFDLNKVEEQRAANIYNNVCLMIVLVITVINAMISGFELKSDLWRMFKTNN